MFPIVGQQSHSLFLMHYLPQSNLMNPAVPISCKWFIGIPVLSSVHLNYANGSFSYKNVFTPATDTSYNANIDGALKYLRNRNYIGTEVHTQLFALGHRRGDYSFLFTITEKDNLPVIYRKDPVLLAWGGNAQFVGQDARFNGTGVYYNHYREYALSVSKHRGDGIYYGLRAKLLFGKLNVSTRKTDITLHTEDPTYNLDFDGELKVHTSLPIVVTPDPDGGAPDVAYDENTNITGLIFNRKNPGFAIDLGVIWPYSEKMEISAALLDVGLIRWRSNLNTFIGTGQYYYDGPLDEFGNPDFNVDSLMGSLLDSMNIVTDQQKYFTMLPPRLLVGANYSINQKLKTGLQGELIAHRSKLIPSITLSANYNLFRHTYLMASYTYQYNTLRNFGFGFVLGRNPVQFYMISDNAAGFIWPLSSRNFNLRFGLNINLGCTIKTKDSPKNGAVQGNCYWLEKAIQKNYQKEKGKR